MILVTAANGNLGRLLVPKLLADGHAVRACVRSEESAGHLRALGVADVVVGDVSDPGVADRALDGVAKVFHVGPTLHPREREMGFTVVDAARAKGVRHFVFSSVLHAITTDLVQHEIKRDVEEHLLSSGLEFTILQPANYMLPLKLRPVFERDVFELSWSLDRRQSMVDLDDVTDVARLVLADPDAHAGATYELVGPGRYTAHELGEIISRVLGRPIEVREIDADTYLKAWVGDGDPREFTHQIRVLRSISARYSGHDFVGNPNVLTWLLGRPPTTFEEYVRKQHAAFTDQNRSSPG
ncbi:SDR family oxidoreductase [Actinocorallia sp. A-T 12471]|uniref:SDR family oxidoreductase n=1 Tax=Actinocorallia sp. A-T 12471 TaxID=3089813 RepID=UPI0029D0868F|nr:NmrA family NAD(P)-binding protein [Actinocorallia sp. A-T 12471]MDX6739573.1 NmrA family NAD(P)-binding protein [Actinocorallia sp. A-T 12471]